MTRLVTQTQKYLAPQSLRLLVVSLLILLCNKQIIAQSLLDERWITQSTAHFTIYSQVSGNRTERVLNDLERWRLAAGHFILEGQEIPLASVPNFVFVFASQEDFQAFAWGSEQAFFYPTPRANFMALVYGSGDSLNQARHHYGHFLMRNYTDLRIPRWYEEGLVQYLADMELSRGEVELPRYSANEFESSIGLNPEVTMSELLFDETALASPRLIQIGNNKSVILLHYLRHGHSEGFPDRRQQLARYLQLALEGRSQRFAYDQSFDLTVEQLDEEFVGYLAQSSRPRQEIEVALLRDAATASLSEARTLELVEAANHLGELALNSGKFAMAGSFFQAAVDAGSTLARSYSGLADALRIQDEPIVTDEALMRLYMRALELAPDDAASHIDYSVYLNEVVNDCEISLAEVQVTDLQSEIKSHVERAVALAPDSAEVNLAMGEFYLLEGQAFEPGVPYQAKAFNLLPADTFILEQTIRYSIESENFSEAERLINELFQPLHFMGEPAWVSNLRSRLAAKQQGVDYLACKMDIED